MSGPRQAEREYMRAMAATGDDPVPTSVVADELGRKPSSLLAQARDGLIKKGLIYSSERGLISAFTVPHFGRETTALAADLGAPAVHRVYAAIRYSKKFRRVS